MVTGVDPFASSYRRGPQQRTGGRRVLSCLAASCSTRVVPGDGSGSPGPS
jgi:hypothetical protein